MKKIIITLILTTFYSCHSQSEIVLPIANDELSYFLSNIILEKTERRALFNAAAYITVFEISDSKATKKKIFEGTDEVLSSYYISIIADGDYYTTSKLYKIEGLINPKIVIIQENDFPNFSIAINHGLYNKRIKKNTYSN